MIRSTHLLLLGLIAAVPSIAHSQPAPRAYLCTRATGIVQFTARHDGQAAILPDRFAEARRVLHMVYYAQKEFLQATHAWARDVKQLTLNAELTPSNGVAVTITPILTGYVATLDLADPAGAHATIRDDSRFWIDSSGRR